MAKIVNQTMSATLQEDWDVQMVNAAAQKQAICGTKSRTSAVSQRFHWLKCSGHIYSKSNNLVQVAGRNINEECLETVDCNQQYGLVCLDDVCQCDQSSYFNGLKCGEKLCTFLNPQMIALQKKKCRLFKWPKSSWARTVQSRLSCATTTWTWLA